MRGKRRAGDGGKGEPPEDSFMRFTDVTAKLLRSIGVEEVVGRRATAGLMSLDAMVGCRY